jgi:hypothetical protein
MRLTPLAMNIMHFRDAPCITADAKALQLCRVR